MTWFKVDDAFHSHLKTMSASLEAIGLWVIAGSWCSNHLTDGEMPEQAALMLARGNQTIIDELVNVGLWKRLRKGGYKFHEFHENSDGTRRNPEAKQVREERIKRAEAGRKGGLTSGKRRSKTEANTQAFASPLLDECLNPRPDPYLEGSKEPSSPTRVPDNFTLDSEMARWAATETPRVNAKIETQRFVNYWQGRTGKGATKTDWVRTWRNWMLKAEADAQQRGTKPQRPGRVIDRANAWKADLS